MNKLIAGMCVVGALLGSVAAGRVEAAVLSELFDPLDNTNRFIDATLTVTDNGNGTVSLTRVSAGGDLVAHWGKNGADERILYGDSRLEVESTASINNGTWGFDIQWFDVGGGYLGQNTFQTSTGAVGLFTYNVTGAPVGTVSWRPQFRVGTGTGEPYGFTFTQINAYQVPEPSVAALGLIGVVIGLTRKKFKAD